MSVGAAIDTSNFRMCSINRDTRQSARHRRQCVSLQFVKRGHRRVPICPTPRLRFLPLNVDKRAWFLVRCFTLHRVQKLILNGWNNSGDPAFVRSLNDHALWTDSDLDFTLSMVMRAWWCFLAITTLLTFQYSGRSFRALKWTHVGASHVQSELLSRSAIRSKKSSKLGVALLPRCPKDQTSGGRAKTDANDRLPTCRSRGRQLQPRGQNC